MEREWPLPPDDIQLWVCRDECIVAVDLLAEYSAVLSDSERQRMAQFHFARHRHQYLVTRALVRHVLSMYRPDVAAHQWRFAYNDHGKPRIDPLLDPSQSLHFNVSHTDGLIVMAVSRQAIGIDVEDLLRGGDAVSVADTFFAPAERQDLQQCRARQRTQRFFELWTLKEAYIKARGEGLAVPLDSFVFLLGQCTEHSIQFIPPTNDPRHWQFWSTRLLGRYCLAIAAYRETAGVGFCLRVQEIIPRVRSFDMSCLCWRQDAPDIRTLPWKLPGVATMPEIVFA
ncbi:4'-phosphopantetheinyl transferase family protein [Pseudomonas fluorescens]|uniref:4'-phosphopantetheinyl transferase superfamily protein n=1 Tax=Pseudomonas fluorescens TaxID=294 RepID=A0AAE2Q3Z4_PSEFL|nr:4'-phosphopantetheinyl transferase superfamily protein [Pseudomonas fluorescens]MBD8273030.1 4'-phosphopantetheinyl transferase superfamily protein [Pseudomonas fluorescens]